MKRIELLFSAILVPVDYLMIVLAGLSAYGLRFQTNVTDIRPVFDTLTLSVFFPALLLGAIGWLVIFSLSGMYAIRGTRRFRDEATNIFLGCSTSVMATIVLFFFQREVFASRFIVLTGWVLAIVYVTMGRLLIRTVQRSLLKRGVGIYHVLLVGQDHTAAQLLNLFRSHPSLGYRVKDQLGAVDELSLKAVEENYLASSGHRAIDIILQADPTLEKAQTEALIDFANYHHLTFRYAADLFASQAPALSIETVAGIPVIEMKRTKLDGWGRIFKRAADMALSFIVLIALMPLFIVTAIFIRADTEGPILVKLRRIGESGKPFDLYKFRSMVVNAHAMKAQLMEFNERSGPLFKMKNDPRITRVGRFLRRTSIDELPQLLNVLKGQMSIVGPRPHEPEEVARYERHHRKLLTIKPGITGLAQISGRSELDFAEEARIDIAYIEQWTMWLDLTILCRTPLVVLRMKSAS